MSTRPAVSVCIPAYNSARFIGEAVSSVLDQTFDDLELVVVDDASHDGTAAVVECFSDRRIRFYRNDENVGAVANWNRTVSLARGKFVKLLCGDDALRPGCLAEQARAMEVHPEVSLVAGQRDVVTESGRLLLTGRGLPGLEGVVEERSALRTTVRAGTNVFGEPACVLMRADLIARCGPFSGRRPYMIDLDYWCRMLRLGQLFAQRKTVAVFRISLQSWSVELARHQSAQAIDFFRSLHLEAPELVDRRDVALGAARARGLALGRAASYRVLRALYRTSPPVPGAVADQRVEELAVDIARPRPKGSPSFR